MGARGRGVPLVLSFFAHPDDEATWAGALLARCAAAGAHVALVSATAGEAGEVPSGRTRSDLGGLRERELRCAARALGARSVRVLGYPDGHLGALDPVPVVERIRTILSGRRPAITLTFGPDGGDGHPDHVAVSRLVTAAWAAAGLGSGAVLYYALPAARGVADELVLIATDAELEAKLRAAACHGSQPECARELADRPPSDAGREVFRLAAGEPADAPYALPVLLLR